MKVVKFLILVLLATLVSCGTNGEISTWNEQSTPTLDDNPIVEDQDPVIQMPECPTCPEAGCCDCGEDDDDDNPGTIHVGQYKYDIPKISGVPINHIPQPFNQNSDQWERICMDITNYYSHWWLVHQMTGGILKYADLTTQVSDVEQVAGGIVVHYESSMKTKKETALEMDYFLGTPVLVGGTVTNVTAYFEMRFTKLSYDDPVFGAVGVDGAVRCQGKNYKNTNSQKWNGTFECSVIGGLEDPLLFKMLATDYDVDFQVQRNFINGGLEPQDFTFLNGVISIDRHEYDVEEKANSHILQCLDGGPNTRS